MAIVKSQSMLPLSAMSVSVTIQQQGHITTKGHRHPWSGLWPGAIPMSKSWAELASPLTGGAHWRVDPAPRLGTTVELTLVTQARVSYPSPSMATAIEPVCRDDLTKVMRAGGLAPCQQQPWVS